MCSHNDVLVLLERANCVYLFPTLPLVTSLWYLEIILSESICTTEIGKSYKSGLYLSESQFTSTQCHHFPSCVHKPNFEP